MNEKAAAPVTEKQRRKRRWSGSLSGTKTVARPPNLKLARMQRGWLDDADHFLLILGLLRREAASEPPTQPATTKFSITVHGRLVWIANDMHRVEIPAPSQQAAIKWCDMIEEILARAQPCRHRTSRERYGTPGRMTLAVNPGWAVPASGAGSGRTIAGRVGVDTGSAELGRAEGQYRGPRPRPRPRPSRPSASAAAGPGRATAGGW